VTPASSVANDVKTVGPNGYRATAIVRILAIGAPRWNTPTGRVPTQAEVDAMVETYDVQPSIFRPVTVQIEHVYAGPVSTGRRVVYAETGTIGNVRISSCAFGSATTMQIREGPDVQRW